MARGDHCKTIHEYVDEFNPDFNEYGFELSPGILSVVVKNEGNKEAVSVSPYSLEDILKFIKITNRLRVERLES